MLGNNLRTMVYHVRFIITECTKIWQVSSEKSPFQELGLAMTKRHVRFFQILMITFTLTVVFRFAHCKVYLAHNARMTGF